MEKKIDTWNKTCNRFVAFLDIMGFKDRLQREGHEEVGKMFESLHPIIDRFEKEAKKRLQEIMNIKEKNETAKTSSSFTLPVTFSDSIILFSSDDSEDSAISIMINIATILSEAIKNKIPMKGAIAFGEMTIDIDNSLYYGQPLIDAYELHKELEIYGVVLHHTTQKRLEELGLGHLLTSMFLRKYFVPMKSGKISHNFINWAFMTEKPLDLVNNLYTSVSGSPRKYVDNTIEFLEWLEKEEAKFAKKKAKDILV